MKFTYHDFTIEDRELLVRLAEVAPRRLPEAIKLLMLNYFWTGRFWMKGGTE